MQISCYHLMPYQKVLLLRLYWRLYKSYFVKLGEMIPERAFLRFTHQALALVKKCKREVKERGVKRVR